MRRFHGRTGTAKGDARKSAIFIAERELAQCPNSADGSDRFDYSDGRKYFEMLSRFDRLVYGLVHKYEVDRTIIADCLGISESALSRIVKQIQERLDRLIEKWV